MYSYEIAQIHRKFIDIYPLEKLGSYSKGVRLESESRTKDLLRLDTFVT